MQLRDVYVGVLAFKTAIIKVLGLVRYNGTQLIDKDGNIISVGGGGAGDMLKSTYDPGNFAAQVVTVTGTQSITGTKTLSSPVLITPDLGTPSALNLTNATDVTNKRLMTDAERTKLTGIATGADVTSATNIASSINGVAQKSTPAGGDSVPLIDVAGGNVLKRITWTSLLARVVDNMNTLHYVTYDSAAQTLKDNGTSISGIPSLAWAGFPQASLNSGAYIFGTDVGTKGTLMRSDGTRWRPAAGNRIEIFAKVWPTLVSPTLTRNSAGKYTIAVSDPVLLANLAQSGDSFDIMIMSRKNGTGTTNRVELHLGLDSTNRLNDAKLLSYNPTNATDDLDNFSNPIVLVTSSASVLSAGNVARNGAGAATQFIEQTAGGTSGSAGATSTIQMDFTVDQTFTLWLTQNSGDFVDIFCLSICLDLH